MNSRFACLLATIQLSFILPVGGVTIWPVGDSLTSGFTRAGAYRPQLYADLRDAGKSVKFLGSATNDSTSILTTTGQDHHDGHSSWFIADTPSSSIDNGKGIYESVAGWHSVLAPPEVILLLIGTNDLNQNNQVATAPARFEFLLSRLEALSPSGRIIVGSVPKASESNIYKDASVTNLNASINTYNTAVQGIVGSHSANGKNVEFLDINSAMTLSDLGSDGLHFSQAGYNKLGSLWATAIQIPEPSSSWLLATSCLMVAIYRRR